MKTDTQVIPWGYCNGQTIMLKKLKLMASKGGKGNKGRVHTQATKDKIRRSMLSHWGFIQKYEN